MSDLSPYRSSDDRERTLESRAKALGAEIQVLGQSHEGRPIRAARVPSTAATSHKLLVCAGIHGLEYIGTEVALAFLDALSGSSLADLRANAEIWVLPSLNPDAYDRTWQAGGKGKLSQLRVNTRGVDLNRNYPLPGAMKPVLSNLGGWRTGSDDPKNSFYRGTAPLSEPEAAALDALCARTGFTASVNLHSTMGTVITPCLREPRQQAEYTALCEAFTAAQPHTRYKRITGGSLDRFTGEQEDHQHHAFHTWAITVEHYPIWIETGRFLKGPIFWQYNPRDPVRWVDNDVPGIAAFFRAAIRLDRP